MARSEKEWDIVSEVFEKNPLMQSQKMISLKKTSQKKLYARTNKQLLRTMRNR